MAKPRIYSDIAHLPSAEYSAESHRRRNLNYHHATHTPAANPQKRGPKPKPKPKIPIPKKPKPTAMTRQEAHRLRRYKITPVQHKAMLDAQGNACAICRKPFEKEPVVDHCHDTGKVRGLLCRNCNVGIGMLNDDADLLEQAASYLRECS